MTDSISACHQIARPEARFSRTFDRTEVAGLLDRAPRALTARLISRLEDMK
jgi:hypothetical protein